MKLNKFNKLLNNKTSLGLTALIIIGIVVVLNFFSYQLFYRFDLTENKDFSLSAPSKELAKNLDDVVTIKAYFSKELPSQYVNLSQEVGDILDEYQNFSKGKIRYEFIDPKDDKDVRRDLASKGVPELQFNVLEKDKYQVVNGYLGMVISYLDKSEVMPVVQDTNNLEYQITSNIKKMTAKTTPTVAVVTSNASADPDKDYSRAYKALESIYKVERLDLAQAKKVPDQASTLVLVGPTEKFSDEELRAIDDFLMRGGSILFMIDGVKVGENLAASKNDVGLSKILEKYGVKVNQDLVLDASSGVASFNQGFLSFSINYPFWPKTLKPGFDKDSVAMAKLESIIFPWASSVEIQKDKIDQTNKVYELVKTSPRSWLEKSDFILNPQQEFRPTTAGQYDLAVAVFGKFQSAFGKKEIGNGRIIVIGDSDFVRDSFADGADNLAFFQNAVDVLTQDEQLISIRAKGVSGQPITRELPDKLRTVVRYANVLGITVIVLAFGLYRYYARRRAKKNIEGN